MGKEKPGRSVEKVPSENAVISRIIGVVSPCPACPLEDDSTRSGYLTFLEYSRNLPGAIALNTKLEN
jgi:hypothetical protein